MISGGFGQQGSQQANDCTFHAGRIGKTPIKIHYFLALMFAYQVFGAYQQHASPWWWPILFAVGTQLLLLGTILCHEFGHGTMARALGGEISHILLWPFGGICFSTRPPNIYDPKQKVRNELKIVCAGPATHFLQAPFWLAMLYLMRRAYSLPTPPEGDELWWLLVPLSPPPGIPMFDSMWVTMLWMLCSWAVGMGATIAKRSDL